METAVIESVPSYVERVHGGNLSAFAREMRVDRDVARRWDSWLIVNGQLYSPKRKLPGEKK